MSPGPARTVEQMELDLRELIATVQCPHLRGLLETIFAAGSPTWAMYREWPAAKHYHEAYAHGLLEHSLTVAQAVSALSSVFGTVDRDIAVTAALLHDLGKLEVYTTTAGRIEMTDPGRLHGEIALGFYRIRRVIEELDGFPGEREQALLHIILGHHGSLEHGSPVVPATREATLVHMADNLGSKLGSFDRIERSLEAGAEWSDYDRGLGTPAYFGGGATAPPLPVAATQPRAAA